MRTLVEVDTDAGITGLGEMGGGGESAGLAFKGLAGYLVGPTRSSWTHDMKALARAWRWQKLLDRGVYGSVTEIAEA